MGLLGACQQAAPLPPTPPTAEPLPVLSAAAAPPPSVPEPKLSRAIGPKAKRLAEAVSRAFSNLEPRPVTREFAQQPWVLFQTDRTAGRPLGPLVWREAPVRVLHGRTEVPVQVEPCARPLLVGEAGEARGGTFRIERGSVFDRVHVDHDKMAVKLPAGAFHGGCLVDEKRLWIAWSTPRRPAELFTITLKDGVVRPLRDEARPTLGGLADFEIVEDHGMLVAHLPLAEGAKARGIVVLLEAVSEERSLGAYSPVLRAFVEERFVVVRRRPGSQGDADVAELIAELRGRDRIETSEPWVAQHGQRPLDAPPRSLWIDPADPERTLAEALSVVSPEALLPSAGVSSAPAAASAVPGP